MKFPRRGLKVLGWSLGIVSVLVLGLLLSVYFILRSPAIQQKILLSIKEPLAAAGLATEIDRLSIDLLGGVSLDGMTLRVEKAPLAKGVIKLEKLRLAYALWPLLERRLQISELALEGIDGQLVMELPTESPEPAPGPPPDIKALLDLLRQPPLTLDGPELSIRRLRLDLKLRRGPLEVHSLIDETSFVASVEVEPGRIKGRLEGDIATQLDLRMAPEGAPALALQSGIRLRLNPQFVVGLQGQAPEEMLNWQIEWPELFLALKDLSLAQSVEAQKVLGILWPAMEWQQKIVVQHEALLPAEPQINDLIWPIEVNLEQKLSGASLSLEQKPLGAEAMRVRVKPALDNELSLSLPTLEALKDAAWSIDQKLVLEGLAIEQGAKSLAATPLLQLTTRGKGDEGEGTVETDLSFGALKTPYVQVPLTLEQKIKAKLVLAERRIKIEGSTRLNNFDLLRLNLDAKDPSDKNLEASLQLKVQTDPILNSIHEGMAALETIGYPHIGLDLTAKIIHEMPIQEITPSQLNKLTITNSLHISMNQTHTSAKTLALFKKLELEENSSWLAENLKIQLKIGVDELKHPALLRPVDLKQTLSIEGQKGSYLQGQLSAQTTLGKNEILDFRAKLEDKAKEARITSELKIRVKPELKNELEALKILDDTGPLTIKGEQTISLKHGAPSLQEVKDFSPNKLKIDALLTQLISSDSKNPNLKYQLIQPLRIESRAQLTNGKGDLTTRVLAKELKAKDLASVKDLRVGVIAKVSDIETQKLLEAKVVTQIAKVDLLGELGEKPELKGLLERIQLVLDAQLERKEKLVIKNLYAGLQHPLLQFKGQGQFHLAGRGNFDGKVEVNMPDKPIAGLKGKGTFRLPLRLTAYDQKKIAIRAAPEFQAFSAELGDLAIRNAQGSIQIHEELSLDKEGKIGFLYLNTQNPFVRVDYDSVEPYVGDQVLLSIDELRQKHIALGPLVMNFEVQQNLIYLNDFKADLLGGSALGRMYFDLHPERLQLGFLGRFSNLQPELLKEPARRSANAIKEGAVLSGRMGTSFDMRQRLASGRIDLTAIGQRQLASLLDVLDPQYKDEQIGMARRAIQVSYPKSVTIAMNQGLMDLSIVLGGAISKDINIRSIPLTGFINANLGPALEKVQKIVQEGEVP